MAGNHRLCLSGASIGTMIRVYVAYMESRPKDMDVEKSAGLTNALLALTPARHQSEDS